MQWGALKTAVANWCNRTDITSLMSTFLDLAEQRIYNGMPDMQVDQLRLSRMLTTVSPFATATIPSDNVQLDRITAISNNQRRVLELRPLGEISVLQAQSGWPAFYGLAGLSVIYGPPADATTTLELLYYAKFASPSADTDENWLMANASGVYLYAMAAEVGNYLRDTDMRDSNLKLWAVAQRAVMAQDDQDQHAGSTLRVVNNAMTRW